MCTTMEDCDFITKQCENRKAPVWVAMEYRYMPPVAELINYVHNKEIGELKNIIRSRTPFPIFGKSRRLEPFSTIKQAVHWLKNVVTSLI